jgi:hypothetical protein
MYLRYRTSTQRVTLTPKAGFVVKTTNDVAGIYTIPSRDSTPTSTSSPASNQKQIVVPRSFKIFLNICWDQNVPAPPQRSEEDIRRAMMGEDLETSVTGNSGPYFVPVVVSDGRPATDKGQYLSSFFFTTCSPTFFAHLHLLYVSE